MMPKEDAKSLKQIVSDIETHILQSSSPHANWYVGITKEPKKRLHEDHNVPKKNHYWIYRWAENHQVARSIEKFFIEDQGTQGGDGGGDARTRCVYAYEMDVTTDP